MKKTVAAVLSFVLVLGSLFIGGPGKNPALVGASADDSGYNYNSSEDERYVSGRVNEKLSWIIDKQEKRLTVTCDGNMVSFANDTAPWINYSSCFETIIVENGCTSIGEKAFYYCDNVVAVELPDTVKSIGNYSFSGCTNLTTITIPDSVMSIGSSAFKNCSGLTTITIPDGVTSIGDSAFFNCSGLTSITIPNSVISINYSAFHSCIGLTELTIPDGVETIGVSAFANCKNLISIKIGRGITTIYGNAFSCEKLEFVTILNRTCTINENSIPYYVTICGFAGSSAEAFANEYGYVFHSIDDEHEHVYENACDNYCNYCGEYRETEGHNFGEETVIVNPDCVHDGRSERVCEYCGAKLIVIYPALGHEFGEEYETIRESTCSYQGWEGRACIRCHLCLEERRLPLAEHNFGNYAVAKEPTCTSEGLEVGICEACGALVERNIPKSEHVDGDNDKICDICFNPYSTEYIASGKMSDDVSWKLSDVGELTVYGVGFVPYFPIYYYSTTRSNYQSSTDYSYSLTTRVINTRYHEYVDERVTSLTSTTHNTEPYSYISETQNPDLPSHSYAPVDERNESNYSTPYESSSSTTNSYSEKVSSYISRNYKDYTLPENTTGYYDWFYSNSWYDYRPFIKKITIKDGITEIGDCNFYGCYNATEVDIASSVTYIGNRAFQQCTSLESVVIPAGVRFIGNNCFSNCYSLENLEIGENVETIGNSAFSNLKSLKNLTFNACNAVVSGWYYANLFANAGSESEGIRVVFGDSVEAIPNQFFSIGSETASPNIREIVFGANVSRIGERAFDGCGTLTEFIIPSTVEVIGSGAFANCTGLTEIVIPENVDYIGENAFTGCDSLKTIRYNAANADCAYAFDRCAYTDKVYIGEGVQKLCAYAFTGCTHLKNAYIPDIVIDIDSLAFYGCGDVAIICKDGSYANAYAAVNGLKYMLSNSEGTVFEIKNNVLISYSGSARNVVVPAEITAIGINAFAGTDVTCVELPYSVNKIYSGAFSNCNSLEKVIVPYTVTSIADNAFAGSHAAICCYYGSYAAKYAQDKGIPVEIITVNFGANKLSLYKGQKKTIDYEPSVTLACGLPVAFSSDNAAIAAVDESGNVTGTAQGRANITAYTQAGNRLGSITVSVSGIEPKIGIVKHQNKIDVSYWSTVILHADAVLPDGAKIKWYNDSDKFLTEGKDYKVTNAENSYTVYAAIVDGESGEIIARTPAETVNVKSGIFQKLIAFIRNLFKKLPVVDQK